MVIIKPGTSMLQERTIIRAMIAVLAVVPCAAQVKINQVWTGAGYDASAPNTNYVQLYNSGDEPVSLSGWSVHYRQVGHWTRAGLSGSIAGRSYYLVSIGQPNSVGVPLPPPDVVGPSPSSLIRMVALTSNSVPLAANVCPLGNPALVDLVGWKSTCYEGTGPAPTPTWTGSYNPAMTPTRKCDGNDTDENASDFELRIPSPRNSASPPSDGQGVTLTSLASPPGVNEGESTIITVTVGACTGKTTGGVLLADFSPLGGPAMQPLLDDGQPPDEIADDLVFTTRVLVADTTGGSVMSRYQYEDEEGRVASAYIRVDVPCRYDITGDGEVRRDDLGVVLGSYGLPVPPYTHGDFDGNGLINQADLGALVSNYLCEMVKD